MGNQLCMLPLLELIEERYSDQEELVQMAGFARTTHERLLQIINEVKAFVRFEREQVAMQPIGLAGVLHELLEFVRHERSLPLERLTVEIEADTLVQGNRIKLQQVILNLLKNAGYAIRGREDGHITLRLSSADSDAAITVSDNGCGMTPEIADRIWEPFFTTKGAEGTGVGLDVSRSIVEAHGGTIDCLTAPDQGATFTIRLPVCNEAQAPHAAPLATGGLTQALATPQTV
jgi:signal transduction histidine kinase